MEAGLRGKGQMPETSRDTPARSRRRSIALWERLKPKTTMDLLERFCLREKDSRSPVERAEEALRDILSNGYLSTEFRKDVLATVDQELVDVMFGAALNIVKSNDGGVTDRLRGNAGTMVRDLMSKISNEELAQLLMGTRVEEILTREGEGYKEMGADILVALYTKTRFESASRRIVDEVDNLGTHGDVREKEAAQAFMQKIEGLTLDNEMVAGEQVANL